MLTKYLTDRLDLPLLMRFSFTGVTDQYNDLLSSLIYLAESEPWTCEVENDILKAYLNKTFEKCFYQNDITVTQDENHACFDTGLLSKQLEKIYGYFEKNPRLSPYWKLKNFLTESDRLLINLFPTLPKKANFFNSPEEHYFNPNARIVINSLHIVDSEDHVFDRFPEKIKSLPTSDLISLINGKLGNLQNKIERNPRIVIPLFYKGKITFACPITILGDIFALIIEKFENGIYRVNTIYPIKIAYKKARILLKPEAIWLSI